MKTKAFVYEDGSVSEKTVEVSDEELVTIHLNGLRFISLFALPRNLRELAVGFVVSEGITDYDDILGVQVEDLRVNVEIKKKDVDALLELRSSGCSGVMESEPTPISSKKKFNRKTILDALGLLHDDSLEWKRTGGTHYACVISDDGKKICGFEDVGRHNALDKAIGWGLSNNIRLDDKIVLFTGRLSTGITAKAARAEISTIVSNTSALSQAIKLAEKLDLTLIGFARGKRFTVYTHPWRVE